jgi:hypothetical protein
MTTYGMILHICSSNHYFFNDSMNKGGMGGGMNKGGMGKGSMGGRPGMKGGAGGGMGMKGQG